MQLIQGVGRPAPVTGFAAPGWLGLLVAVAALAATYVAVQWRKKKYVARFTNVELLSSVVPRRPGWRRHLTFALLLSALAVFTVGLAQPTAAVRVARDRATVMLAIDVSPSMVATDVLPTRLRASQDGAKLFARLLPARINLGLVKFGGQASVVVPPTLDRGVVTTAISNLHLIPSTAIGEAVFTSLDAITTFATSSAAAGDTPPPARIVLMSDGANNRGRSINTAAAAAMHAKVPVSTIAFGTDQGVVVIGGETLHVPADKAALRTLAAVTGGTFHVAASADQLRSVYADIGSQVGYATVTRIDTWWLFALGSLLAFSAGASGMLWSGRLA